MATLTFLNTTGSPALSRDLAKKMRGHITRINFAKRRELKLTRTTTSEEENESRQAVATLEKRESFELQGLANRLSRSSTRFTVSTFSRLWSLLFLNSDVNHVDTNEEAAWLGLLISDPAFLNATLSVGIGHWSPEPIWRRDSGIHLHRAVSSMIERIGTGRGFTDGGLGAALTMAFGERLAQNDIGWNVHVSGVAQMIRERRSRGIAQEPSWFFGLMAWTIVDALGTRNSQVLTHIADVIDKLVALRKTMKAYHEDPTGSESLLGEISKGVQELYIESKALQSNSCPEVKAAALSVQILLHFSWPSSSPENLTLLASNLRAALDTRKIIQCSYMDMTSCQLMLGAMSADYGSETKAWFAGRLKAAVIALRSRGLVRPFMVTDDGLVLDQALMEPFRNIVAGQCWKPVHG
ncbi:hypothetical protein CH63R_12315 [Colletotrichum higginsianum IMI 349063]|uniref:Uncharacterized protein n=2 Tax=Colletotrichum higginsianum TaxID=80884 RepID=A0A1B7XTV9_COLHI|nr:hypothetical protein CH63R_12315 [Colletotrichum higginsianum IMI 349063]OBR03188.1 hypothetical protein CH63R_12315 [Colletotrichum higginsianum IMI 349063]